MIASITTIIIGIALSLAPRYLGYADTDPAAFDRVMGPTLVAFGLLSLWETMAFAKWLAAMCGLAILTSTLWLRGTGPSPDVLHVIAGLLVTGVSLIPKRRTGRFGGGWPAALRERKRLDPIEWR
jgi:hypothetical protein